MNCKTAGLLTDADMARIEEAVAQEIEEAVAFAEAGTWEPVEDLTPLRLLRGGSRMNPNGGVQVLEPAAAKVRTITYREAVREGLREAMQRDERVFLMGEDVGRYGGCFAVSMGLLEEFGPERIRDTPLSESAFTGAGIGAALNGMRPIVEIMTCNFSLLAADQIDQQRGHAAAHVWRPVQCAAGHSHVHRRRQAAGGAALPQLGRLVRAHPRPESPGPGHDRRCARHALARLAGPGPGADFRERDCC